jgi:hypothetical protein
MIWPQSADKRVNPHLAMGHLRIGWILYGQYKAKERGAQEYQESGGCCPALSRGLARFVTRTGRPKG